MYRPLAILSILTAVSLISPRDINAMEVSVPAEPGAITSAIDRAEPGDVLRLAAGVHPGCIIIDRPLVLDGDGRAAISGCGHGSVITVDAPDVVIRGLIVSGSGSSGEDRDAGIRLQPAAVGALVLGNVLRGNLVGIDIHGARDARVEANVIVGRRDHRMNERGNGIYLWNAPGAVVADNDIQWGRDGIFVNTSKGNRFTGNRFRDLRFAVHYMYAHDSEVRNNVSSGNHLGFAMMFSRNLKIVGNVSRGDRDYGLMLNYTNDSVIADNLISGTADRCVFIYNAHKNTLTGNRFERCAVGIHFTAGSERNDFIGNAFVDNRQQVKYVGSRWVEWSGAEGGNYWSDHSAYDLNGDGLAETAYRPNDSIDRVLWTQPAARMLLGSPAIHLIRWVQSRFPAFLPGGVVDSRPLMAPPVARDIAWQENGQ